MMYHELGLRRAKILKISMTSISSRTVDPTGEAWSENDVYGMFPKLTAQFG
jgi:hypothetical protein